MAIRVKIVEGAMNYPQSTAPIGRQSVDTQDMKFYPPLMKPSTRNAKEKKKRKRKKTTVVSALLNANMIFIRLLMLLALS